MQAYETSGLTARPCCHVIISFTNHQCALLWTKLTAAFRPGQKLATIEVGPAAEATGLSRKRFVDGVRRLETAFTAPGAQEADEGTFARVTPTGYTAGTDEPPE